MVPLGNLVVVVLFGIPAPADDSTGFVGVIKIPVAIKLITSGAYRIVEANVFLGFMTAAANPKHSSIGKLPWEVLALAYNVEISFYVALTRLVALAVLLALAL